MYGMGDVETRTKHSIPSDYHPELVGRFQFADGFHMLKVKSVIIIILYNSYISFANAKVSITITIQKYDI